MRVTGGALMPPPVCPSRGATACDKEVHISDMKVVLGVERVEAAEVKHIQQMFGVGAGSCVLAFSRDTRMPCSCRTLPVPTNIRHLRQQVHSSNSIRAVWMWAARIAWMRRLPSWCTSCRRMVRHAGCLI